MNNTEEFDLLFQQVTGTHPLDAKTNNDGWLLVEGDNPSVVMRHRLSALAMGYVDGDWIKRPN